MRGDVYDKLKAVPGGPYSVRRGGQVELDGSASKPKKKITSYVWTFVPHCPGGVEGQPSSKAGAKVKIVAICKTTAILTVSSATSSDSKSTTIRVGGKLRDVKFKQAPDADTGNFPFDTSLGFYVFGFNRCAIEWAQSRDPDLVDHWLHRPDDGDDVETKQVHDKGGPYDDMFYVTDHKLLVTRQLIINRKLLPGGDVYELNKEGHKEAIENIAEATLDHERIHGTLVKRALESKKLGFLDRLASAVEHSDEALQTRADVIIGDGETELKNASTESKVHNKMADIWKKKKATILRPSDGQPYTYTLASIGDTEAGAK